MSPGSTGSHLLWSRARRVSREYSEHLRQFTPNARLYLVNMLISGAAIGVFRLLFNFYLLSLGYDEVLLGNLVTVNSLTALLVALPCGYLADLIGRKASLLIAGILSSLSILWMVLMPASAVFYAANMLLGLSQSLAAITMGPFLMENSGENERTYLFSFSAGFQMTAASVGSWIGGYLPGWIGMWKSVPATHSTAYAGSLVVIAVVEALGVIPLIFLRNPRLEHAARSVFAPIKYASQHPAQLTKLILPMLLTSIGAGLLMPFMNVFYRQAYSQPDPVIGALFAWGSLAMGIGLLIAPPLADRYGKIQVVVITQALSIPFLVMMGFSPWFGLSAAAYYIRVALMNMSGPVYQTFVMERVDQTARATVASLVSMSWNFGWAFSPMISGWLQVNYGFGPVYLGTIVLYSVSIYLYWAFFWRRSGENVPTPAMAD
jgi:MFS family permease